MPGLYIHIPFCKQACRYCDFYFTVSRQYEDQFSLSLLKELEIRVADLPERGLDSLYLGGGTPSILSAVNLKKIMDQVHKSYGYNDNPEVSIECNPDDLDIFKADLLRELGFNRISIGIQSFREEELKLMRRSHNAGQAIQAVLNAADAGFDNITVDLIYGIPGQTLSAWRDNILRTLELPVNHISAYHLTFEPGTVFDHWRKKGRISPVPEDESVEMYHELREALAKAEFQHYEISNFAKDGWKSRHNQLYWSGDSYLGFGPSAHSFNGSIRSWNTASLKRYINDLGRGLVAKEIEKLTLKESYHDYLITSLRTSNGASPKVIEERFGDQVLEDFKVKSQSFLASGMMLKKAGKILIDPDKWLVADHILRELFLD